LPCQHIPLANLPLQPLELCIGKIRGISKSATDSIRYVLTSIDAIMRADDMTGKAIVGSAMLKSVNHAVPPGP